MPIYEFECEAGHRTEVIFPKNNCPSHIMCPRHKYPVPFSKSGKEIIWAAKAWSKPANIQLGKPTVVFRDASGALSVPESSDAPTPRGMIREEYRGPIERAKLQNEFQKEENANTAIANIAHEMHVTEERKKRHSELKSKLSSMDSVTQAVVRDAMAYTNAKTPKKKPAPTVRIKVDN